MKYPSNLDLSKNAYITFKPFKWKLIGRGEVFTTSEKISDGEMIILPVQSDLTLSEPENWSEGEGGNLLAGKTTVDKIKEIVQSYALKGFEKLAETVAQSVALNAARNKIGRIKDDFLALTYAGIPLFENSFAFSFIPNNVHEEEIIKSIIYNLRSKSLPTFKDGWIEYPDIWDVEIKVGKKLIMRYPYCVITNIETNYNPDGHIHLTKTGNIIRIDLSISIKQITELDRNDFSRMFEGHVSHGE